MIKLTILKNRCGRDIFVNPHHIAAIESAGGITYGIESYVLMQDGTRYAVCERPDKIRLEIDKTT